MKFFKSGSDQFPKSPKRLATLTRKHKMGRREFLALADVSKPMMRMRVD
jgi:hypothetical protein